MLRLIWFVALWTCIGSSFAQAENGKSMLCSWPRYPELLVALGERSGARQVQVVSRLLFMPQNRPIDLFLRDKFVETRTYRVLVVDAETEAAFRKRVRDIRSEGARNAEDPQKAEDAQRAQSPRPATPDESASADHFLRSGRMVVVESQYIRAGEASPEVLKKTRLENSGPGVTLLNFTPSFHRGSSWRRMNVYVIGCGKNEVVESIGSLEISRTDSALCRSFAIGVCLLCYLFAAWATYGIHRVQRASGGTGAETGAVPGGTRYASFMRHLNPVVLSAGADGRGSATRLQILFFSLIVLGLVLYIWMLTGNLTELSTNVLLLMGISGLGATASTAAELSKNRLKFENWAWLVRQGWLPKGGQAETRMARWRDIVSTNGQFDVYRFQMITFSGLVGAALLSAGAELNDLSAFSIPEGLLGVLGLSQVVYVAGKLVAPPTMRELDAQIDKLRAARMVLEKARRQRQVAARRELDGPR